ncbi:protein maelstrom homolog [Macrosteles quadrilineatus]|uniref:protein maelstrom homolog n=1 Tax=Macrosteles quadrilineatus TaxID=74068 RepID=UPI0023E0BB4A|nr:protein maelstrom homolog [Macrosteles quadrilineatus]
MPKNKTTPNAFYFFMLDRRAAYQANGAKFPNGLKDVAEIAGQEWAVLPKAQRKKYEDMAKEEKERLKKDTSRKFTNLHNSFNYLEKTRNEKEETKKLINDTIEKTVASLCVTKRIATFKFYLIHINYFYKDGSECYHPAEIAVSEFSLTEGVTNVFHTIIGQIKIAIGFRLDVVNRTNEVHHIPADNNKGEESFEVVWRNVKEILRGGRNAHGGSYPPMYTMPDNISLNTSMACVRNVVQMLAETSGDNADDFPVFPLEKLFYELKYGCAKFAGEADDPRSYYPSVPFACSRLENDIFNLTEEIACSLHIEKEQVANCSKSFVQRWAYIICDQCCAYLDIEVVPGKHVPSNSAVDSLAKFKERQRVKKAEEAAAKAAQKPFTMVDQSGKVVKSFAPVELEHRPVAKPTVQPTFVRPTALNQCFNCDFPETPIGRGANPRTQRRCAVGFKKSSPRMS